MTMYNKRPKMFINDNVDILTEILVRLDGPSLVSASAVCRLWHTLLSNDLLWERLCFRNVWPLPLGVRHVVAALGGYRRLYIVCVRPVLTRLAQAGMARHRSSRPVWTRQELELSLSLFCIEYYERMSGGGGGSGGGQRGGVAMPASLMFLCKPVNV